MEGGRKGERERNGETEGGMESEILFILQFFTQLCEQLIILYSKSYTAFSSDKMPEFVNVFQWKCSFLKEQLIHHKI